MTNEEVLRVALKRALKSGWKREIVGKRYEDNELVTSIEYALSDVDKHMDLLVGSYIHNPYWFLSHDFAKAFWGNPNNVKMHDNYALISGHARTNIKWVPEWRYHLSQMAMEADIVDYLRKFIVI